jgi:hypothetical protein
MIIFVVTPSIATDFVDYEEGISHSSSSSAATLVGPFTISSLTQSGTTTKATFTDGSTFTTTSSDSKIMLGTAIATASDVYLYLSGSTVYGVLVFSY